MATPGSSFTPTPLGHEDNLKFVRFLNSNCDEAGLFHLVAKSRGQQTWENSRQFPNCWEGISQPRGNSLSSTHQPQCLLSLQLTENFLGFLLRLSRHSPPPTPCHHFNYYDLPASQSGSFMLPIQDYTTPTGNIHCSVMGRSERKKNIESVKYGGFKTVEIRGRSEAPLTIKKAILYPRVKANSEPEELYAREPDWRPL
ncbi:hypothetical protein TNCV_5109891 [Trichonephila clavipes]|nr:hypothetical protein TNCV_5109891 [Trichonephila clavipes]